MSDFSVRSENVDVEQIMRQIRARIREKRGVDYTEDEIRELANVKLEKFIDPRGVRSGLLDEYTKRRAAKASQPPRPNFAFEDTTLYASHRAPLRWMRSLLRPFLKLLFNPNPLIDALHIQAEINTRSAQREDESDARREELDALHYELVHNLVIELTRTTLEVRSLKMRLESMASRLDFDERRARALEGVVQYRAGAVPPQQPPAHQDQGRRDQGRRDQGPRDQGQRPQQGRREQAPEDRWRRPSGPGPSGPGPSVPGSSVPESAVPGAALPASSGAPVEANALDADGNERRARRRRRRGRRRPDDRRPGSDGRPMSEGAMSDDRGPRPESGAPVGPTFRSGGVDEPASDGVDEPSSDSVASPSTPDLKVGPTGDDPGPPPMAARPDPAGGDSGPSGS